MTTDNLGLIDRYRLLLQSSLSCYFAHADKTYRLNSRERAEAMASIPPHVIIIIVIIIIIIIIIQLLLD